MDGLKYFYISKLALSEMSLLQICSFSELSTLKVIMFQFFVFVFLSRGKSTNHSQDKCHWAAAQGRSTDRNISFLCWIIHGVLSYFGMVYSLQLVIKESPRSFKQVIKGIIYYSLPSKRVNFICRGLMLHLLSTFIASSSSKVNHYNG